MTKMEHYPKQLLSVMLAVFIALTLIPLQAAASAPSTEDSYTLTEDCSGYGWTYSAAARTLTLDGAELTYSGSGSLFNFAGGSDVNVAITGYNYIDLQDAVEGASVFSCPNGTISIKSTGILCVNNIRTTNKVYMISAETSAVIDGGYYSMYAFKAADEDSSVTINGGCLIVRCFSEAGSKVTVNGGYIRSDSSEGDVKINGGIVMLNLSSLVTGFTGGSLTYSNCIVNTYKIDKTKCIVSGGENAVLIEDDTGSVTANQNKSFAELRGIVTGGLYADTYYSNDKHCIIRSDAKLKGAFYFSSGNVTVEAGADLSEATLYVSSPYNVSEPALVFDGNIARGTICAYDCSDLSSDSVAGIKIQGSARITGGNLIGLSRKSIGVDISADGGSISGTQIIGISPISTSPSDSAAGVKLNSCFDADPTSSIIGYGDSIFGYENRDGGGVTLGENATQLPDCTISTKGKDGSDFVLTTPLKFDLKNGSDSIYGTFDPNKNCSGKGWKYFKDSFDVYEKFLPDTDRNYGLLVLDELRYVTTIDNAAIEITGNNIGIDGLVIVVKGECLLKNMGKGIYSDISVPVLLVGYDESARLSVQSKYPNEKKDHPDHNIENAVYTSGDLTIKDLAIDVSVNALRKQMIYAGNDLIVMNSNITSDLNIYGISSENFRPLCSGKDMYIVGSNTFTFVGKDEFYFTSESGSIYTSIFKLMYGSYKSHTAEKYNDDIISGKEIKEISSNEYNKSFSTVAFDFNEEKYDISISDDKSVVTLTDKTPAVYYGGDTFEINADDFFVGGNMNYTLNSGSLSSTDLGGSYDPDEHIFSCAPKNEDGDYTVSLTYHNKIDDTSESARVNLLTGLPENVTVEYKFKVEKTPEINVTYNAEGGEVTVSPERVAKGDNAEVAVTPKEGWRVKSVKVDSADRELTDGKLQLTNITSDTDVEVEFETIPKYKITVTTDGSGKVTPETSEFYEGSSAEFTVTPDKGYYIKSVTVDGNAVELTDGKYTFNNITEEHTLSAEFEAVKYKVTVVTKGSGKVTPETSEFYEGSSAEFTVTPDKGYYIKSVTVDGNAVELTDGKYTFNSITEEHTLSAEFEAVKYKVTVVTKGSGKVTPETSEFYEGSSAEFTVTPDKGYYVKSVTVDGNAVELTDGKYTFNNITEEHTLSVEFEAVKYKVTVVTKGSGKVTPETSEFYEGSSAEFTVTPDKGYYIKSVTVDGNAVELTDGKYTFNNITEEHTLSVVFDKQIYTYNLTVECGANGKASLSDMTDIEEGTVLSCVLTPNAGYEVKSVTLNGKTLSVKDNEVSFEITSNSVLRIEFAKKSAGSSGGSSGGASHRPSTPSETRPAINGIQKNWADIAADIAKLPAGSTAVINLNGETSIPADVIKAIRDVRAKVEFVVDSTRSWIVDGANITAISAADFSMLPGKADKSALRGVIGTDIIINGTGVPAELKLAFRKEFAGQFANLYSLTDGRLVFRNCVKIDENGSAVIAGADVKGEYVVMVCGFSDRPGDMNNDGILNALDASALLKSVIGTETGANPQMADFNGDGVLNALDASAILKWIIAA